jgi:hypothetical protein
VQGDVRQGLRVREQSRLWSRLAEAFAGGVAGLRVLVVECGGDELVVDMKTLRGSML